MTKFLEVQVIDQLLDDAPTSKTSDWVDVREYDQITFCLVSNVTAVGAAPQVTYTVQVLTGSTTLSATGLPTDGTARTYDKLLALGGTDAPVASVGHSSDATAFVAISPEDAVGWVRVVATGANTDADDTVDCDVFLLAKGGR